MSHIPFSANFIKEKRDKEKEIFENISWIYNGALKPVSHRQLVFLFCFLLCLESCISCWQEKRNEKMYSIMANPNLGQDVANKRENKITAVHNSYPL